VLSPTLVLASEIFSALFIRSDRWLRVERLGGNHRLVRRDGLGGTLHVRYVDSTLQLKTAPRQTPECDSGLCFASAQGR
jgi:hypothetical protein